MANTFKNKKTKGIGTTLTLVGSYTVPANTVATVIGCSICNTSNSTINVSATQYDGTNDYYIVSNSTLVLGSTLVISGGDQKIVLTSGEGIRVVSSANSSVDVVLTVLEIS